ncbi:MAG: hypothetical protein Q4D81_01605 [Eubacteriales bacterium]|nr:hypothetical protein [Eubacteriales bacterium]
MASIKCPRITCRSKNCVPVAQDKRYKAGKGLLGAAVGGVLLGPVGAVVGAGTGLNGKQKVKFVCQKCGKIFEVKL